jgi:hypothetical protein
MNTIIFVNHSPGHITNKPKRFYIIYSFRRRIKRKIEDVLGEDQFGFSRGKGTRDTIGMMRIIAERTLEIDEELCIFGGFDRASL